MPCNSDDDEYPQTKHELDRVVRLLCEVCSYAEYKKMTLPPELQIWWREHKRLDDEQNERLRLEKERATLRDKALSKLTSEERRALGFRFDW